jgi:hypothetical protein
MNENNLILVTDWDKVESDNFYLTDDWSDKTGDYDNIQTARGLLNEGKLYVGYIVDAKNYAIYYQLDANEVLIDQDANVIVHCESSVISNDHKHREEFNY